jgi:hypothetical protein
MDQTGLESLGSLFHKAEVRRKRLNLAWRQFAGDVRHRRAGCGMIPLGPLLKRSLQIGTGQATQLWDLPDSFRIGPMTNYAGNDVGIRHSELIDPFALGDELGITVTGRSRRERGKIERQGACGAAAEALRGSPHVLFREWIIARVRAKSQKLIFDILGPLARQPRGWRVALRRGAVAPSAIPNDRTLGAARHYEGRKETGNEHRHS